MIYDAENTFMWKKDLSTGTTSDVVANSGGGDAYDPLFLAVTVNSALDKDATVTISTDDDAAMGSPKTLGSLTVSKDEGSKASVKIPHGMKKYLKLSVTGAATGVLTAALVIDVDLT